MEYDFYKLVDIKSFTKVGIFSPKKSDAKKLLKNMAEIVTYSGIRIPYENYLIIFLIDHGNKENIDTRLEICTYHINFQGTCTPLHSTKLCE